MYGCESWIIKNAKCQKTDAFKLWCWRRLLRVPCTARRSNQSILKEINPEYSLEGLMLKLKLQSFGHLMWRANSKEKTLILGKIEGKRRRGWQIKCSGVRLKDCMTLHIFWMEQHSCKFFTQGQQAHLVPRGWFLVILQIREAGLFWSARFQAGAGDAVRASYSAPQTKGRVVKGTLAKPGKNGQQG